MTIASGKSKFFWIYLTWFINANKDKLINVIKLIGL